MVKFNHYGTNSITENTTVEYEFENLTTIDGISAKILVRHAGKSNKLYLREALKDTDTGKYDLEKDKKGNVKSRKLTLEMIDSAENKTKVLFARTIVAGFVKNTIFDEKGEPVEYSEQNALDFLNAIPEHEFDDLILFCSDMENYCDNKKIDIKVKAKN